MGCVPVTSTLNVACSPSLTTWSTGCVTMIGGEGVSYCSTDPFMIIKSLYDELIIFEFCEKSVPSIRPIVKCCGTDDRRAFEVELSVLPKPKTVIALRGQYTS